MKLSTKLVRVGDRMSVDGEPTDAWHDAKVAHALLRALGEYGFPGATKMITERAESIMASWGVEQEVAG